MALDSRQISGTNFVYKDFTLERSLDDMVELGRDRIELWGVAEHFHIPTADREDVRRLRSQLSERGLRLYCVTPEQVMYPVNVASRLDWLRASSISMFRRAAELCSELGGEVLFLTPGRGFEDEDTIDAWNRSVEGIRGVVDYAEALGVRCVIESLQRRESDLVYDLDTLARYDAAVDHPNLTIVLDTVAMAAGGNTIDEYYEAFGDRITHVHLVDGSPSGHRVWGDGELPLEDYVRVLDEHDFSGMMTFEIFGEAYSQDPLAAHARCQDAVLDAIGALAR